MRATLPPSALPFWKSEHIAQYNRPLLLLCKQHNRLLRDWPGQTPTMSALLHELSLAEMAYMRIYQQPSRNDQSVELVVGRIRVFAGIWANNDGYLRLSAYSVSYADNRSRAVLVAKGFRIAVKGVHIYDGEQHRKAEEADDGVRRGLHIDNLLALRDRFALPDSASQTEDADYEEQRTSNEKNLLGALQQYIDVEHAQEEMVARQTPPFSYISAKAEPRKVVYRQFYRLTLTETDYQRLTELSPSLLRFASDEDEEGLLAQVVNLKPDDAAQDIVISIEKQAQATEIPEAGQLFLTAIPTLQKVRTEVVDKLRQGTTANPWLLPVASGEYPYPSYVVGNDQTPPAAYPPTPSQLQAFRMGLHTPDYILTLGPPGTGKTTVILNWVRDLVSKGERVLVTSQNNKAVDNVLERLAEEKDLQCVRIGAETKVSSSLHPILVDNAATALQERLVENINTTLDYLSNCQQYFADLHTGIATLEELSQACTSLDNKRNRLIKLELEPKQQQHAEAVTEQGAVTEKLNALKGQQQLQAHKYSAWQQCHWLLKPVAWFAMPVLKAKTLLLAKRIERGSNILQRKMQATEQLSAAVTAVQQAIQQQDEALQQAIQARNAAIPEPPTSPYSNVDFGFDLASNSLLINEGELNAQVRKLKARQQVVLNWKQALSTMRQQALYQISLEMVDVVGATCIGINTNPTFKNIPFDTVIVDESGQIQLHNLMVPLSRAKRSILVGDHKQLPPVVQQELIDELEARDVDTDLMKESWFEYLWPNTSEDRKVLLDTQYRCPAIISDFISTAFYDNEYLAGAGMEKKQPLFSFTNSPLVFIDTSSLPADERKETAFYSEGRNQVKNNPLETRTVVSLLELALKERPELGEGEIGIVVPYKNHVVAIREAIRKAQRAGRLDALNIPLDELVASVDSFQGQERDLIIQTFSRSNPAKGVGFLQDWRRLNVGMTRAKAQLILVGDMATLSELGQRKQADPAREFKQAMKTLKEFVKERGHFIDIRDWQAFCTGREN